MTDPTLPILREVAQIPGLLKVIYGDLAKPGVEQVGKALGTVLGLGNTILWPLTILNERAKIALEKNLEKYRRQLDGKDKIVEVPPEVGVPVLERLAYVTDEELSDLYINLLVKASMADTVHFAHPSFVHLINNLSPDEAKLLKEFRTRNSVPFVAAEALAKDSPESLGAVSATIADCLTGLESRIPLSFEQNMVAYFSNFEGLGIMAIRRGIVIANPSLYEDLQKFYSHACQVAFEQMGV